MQALDEGRTESALHWADWALSRRSDDGRIWLLKGLAHLQANQREAAIQALERAAFRMPAHAGSHLGLGWACLLQGDRARARQAFEAGAQASPAFAVALLEGRSGTDIARMAEAVIARARSGGRQASPRSH
jgi:predicted Zn-dependent protease